MDLIPRMRGVEQRDVPEDPLTDDKAQIERLIMMIGAALLVYCHTPEWIEDLVAKDPDLFEELEFRISRYLLNSFLRNYVIDDIGLLPFSRDAILELRELPK